MLNPERPFDCGCPLCTSTTCSTPLPAIPAVRYQSPFTEDAELASIEHWEPCERFGLGTDPDRNQHDWMTLEEKLRLIIIQRSGILDP